MRVKKNENAGSNKNRVCNISKTRADSDKRTSDLDSAVKNPLGSDSHCSEQKKSQILYTCVI